MNVELNFVEKIVYAACGVGMLMAGAGIAYVVNFQGRISTLETQVGYISGASNAPIEKTEEKSKTVEINTDQKSNSKSGIVQSALAKVCGEFMSTYNKIVGDGSI